MKIVNNVKITRYETECFWIDIIETEDMFEAWLTGKDYGVSNLMFGCPKEQSNGHNISADGFMELVENNLDDYIYSYYREYDNGWGDED